MRKQFIAGAKCPQCGLEDKIYIYHENGEDIAQCNACGYQSLRPKDNEPAPDSAAAPTEGVVKFIQ